MPGEVPEDGDIRVNVTIPCCSQAEEDGWGGRELGVEAAALPSPSSACGHRWWTLGPSPSSALLRSVRHFQE